ncbi:MAG: Rne/Rng family ribonuclease [Bryobacterales bacterium]|nr:Rne/Rng family ribonuclease [Bryobacterales bacterium]
MSKELVISADRHETKVAILEDDQLVEIYFQRANEYPLAGSIHKGRVTRVLPGMQSAFVDLGLERDAFLYVSDFFEENEEYDRIAPPIQERARRTEQPGVAELERPVPESAEPRERKTRRSRRRRRARGFPESRYATEASWSRPEQAASRARVFPVLPGESLAKYSSETTAAEGEPQLVEAEAEAEALGSSGPAASTEPQDSSSLNEAERHEALPAGESELAPSEASDAAFEASPSEEAKPSEEIGPEGPPDVAGSAFADPGPIESVSSAAPLEEPVEAEAATEGGQALDQPAAPEEPGVLEAEIREAAPRYPHRLARRFSRRIRSQTRGGAAEAPETSEVENEETEIARTEKSGPSITELLREGQEILVQIAKEPLGQKGARITSHIALPGRYVVYMPTVEHFGVSRKIPSEDERARLRRILQTHRIGIPGGFIIRTAGAGRSEQEIAADMMYLYNLWLDIRQKAEKRPAPSLIHHDLDLVQRVLRDQLTDQFKAIWVDNEEVYETVLRFVERMQPSMIPRVKMYTRSVPIFDAFNITAELEKALRPKVWLKSGGYIVINQTEALVAIDVNTGKFVGKSPRLEDTIVKTNLEAIKEIVRQIRLRDLGGIIVIDFIDMEERKNRQKVFQALEEEMRQDRAPYKILQFNDFGLVAITRKRVKQSLERALCSPCPTCDGAGYVKSVQTVISEILQEARKIAGAVEGPNLVLRVHPHVAKALKSTANNFLEELEEILRRPVLVTGDPELHPERFDLA